MPSEPRPEYHGIKIQETFGSFALAIARRCWGCAIWPALSPFNAFMILTGIETAVAAHAETLRECESGRGVSELATRRWLQQRQPACRATGTTTSPANTAPKGAGAVFTFSLKGATILASARCRT